MTLMAVRRLYVISIAVANEAIDHGCHGRGKRGSAEVSLNFPARSSVIKNRSNNCLIAILLATIAKIDPLAVICAVVLSVLFPASCNIVRAQELEPRAYSPSPIGTNFLAAGYSYSSGDISLDPGLPLTNVEAKIHGILPAYARTFGIMGRAASVAALLPFIDGDITGDIGEEHRQAERIGIGDFRLRLATNLIGGAALSPQEFASQKPATVLGTSLVVVVPTGEYTSERLVNIGANRWAFKPEIGASHQLGNWFVEGSTGAWLFTDNHNFYGGVRRSQDPIATFQVHTGYIFSPGLWLAGNSTYYRGGESTVAGIEKDDMQSNSRYGLTLSVPLSDSWSVKIAWSEGLSTRIGGDFTTIGAAIQYRWFDSL